MGAFVPYQPEAVSGPESLQRAREFRTWMDGRRTVRDFDPARPVSREVMEEILAVAGSAPSGAHKQPWTFVAIQDASTKASIRQACEEQEKKFYAQVAPYEWLRDLEPLGTDFRKSHITDAPWVVVLFAQDYGVAPDGTKRKHYYVQESVGIAAGFFLAAVRQAGLCSLTHTPSPMRFLGELLGRPANERAYLLLPVGYLARDCKVPDLRRKGLEEFVVWR
jgi:iodotyrosine deiodinase